MFLKFKQGPFKKLQQHVTHFNKELKSIQYSLAKVMNHTNVYICTISHKIHVLTHEIDKLTSFVYLHFIVVEKVPYKFH